MSSFGVNVIETGNTDAMLGRIALELRGKALVWAVRASLKSPTARAKALCPKGGPRTGKKSDKKHLVDTITSTVRDYGEVKVGIVGAAYPAGAHAHLVEFGHNVVRGGKVVGRAAPRPFMRPAVEQTMSAQKAAFEASLSKSVAEASK